MPSGHWPQVELIGGSTMKGDSEQKQATEGMNRRDFLKLSGLGIATATLLPACSGFGGASSTSSSSNLIFSHGPEESGALKQLLDQFNKSHDFEVVWQTASADTGAYFDKLKTQLEAGSGPDVISGDVIWPAQFGFNGWVLDLSDMFDESMASGFLNGPIEAVTYQGKRYAVPWFTDAGMMYYRKDLLQKAGVSKPPTTYDELMSVAKQVEKATGTKFGDVFQGDNYEGGVCNAAEFIWGAGGDILDPNDPTKVVIDSSSAQTGLTAERSLVTGGVTPTAVVSYEEQQAHTAFLNGDSVFMRNWPYVVGLAADPSMSKIKPSQLGVTALPTSGGDTGYSCLGGWNLFINAQIDPSKKDKAWEFIKFMAGPQAAKVRAVKGGFLSPLKATYEDQEVVSKVQTIALAKQLADQIKPRPVSPFYSDISLKMQAAFNDNLKGEATPQETVSTLQGEITSIIKQGTA